MFVFRSCAATTVAIMVASVVSHAGTSFRLEVGSPIAVGIAKSKEIKKSDGKFVLAIRTRLCDRPASVTITGTAEGIVRGQRQSIPLQFVAVAPDEGIFMVQQQWPANGSWVLQLNGSCPSPKASASTLVPLDKGTFIREKTEVLGEPATKKQVEAALAALARSQS